MPRLSLWKPERGKDYFFLDRVIQEQFTIGGTDVLVHKYLGPESPSEEEATPEQPHYDVLSETNIQDLVFLENRDRKYSEHVYSIRGIYNVQNIDFDLSQFGLFLSNDILFMTIHINSSVKTIGRKIMSGDVFELPHLKDEYALNDYDVALKRFYVVEDINRAAEGFSPTWYPHLYRVKLKQIYDGQEFNDILDKPADEFGDDDTSLRDVLSTYDKEMQINQGIIAKAEEDALASGFDMDHYYSVVMDSNNTLEIYELPKDEVDPDSIRKSYGSPRTKGYSGYLVNYGNLPCDAFYDSFDSSDSSECGDIAPNGYSFGFGSSLPLEPEEGDYYLRLDLVPNRLFRFDGDKWEKMYDNVRMTLTNRDDRLTHRTSFVNNTNVNTIGGEEVEERQWLSKALRPRPDNK